MLKNLKFIKKIEEFDSKHKYFKWWIVFLVLLPILIIFYLWDNAYISKDIQGDLLYEVYAIKINMFVASLLLLPFYTVSTFKVIKSLQNLINKIHPIIKLIIVVVLIGLIIYLFIEFVYFFPPNTKGYLILPSDRGYIFGSWLGVIYLFLNMIFIGYLISTISLKWDNKDKKENINESTDLKVEQIESNQESEENKKD